MLTKRKYKMRALVQPVPASPTAPVNSTAPAPTVGITSTQMPVTRSTTTSIPVTVYKLATGQFAEVSYLTTRPQDEGHPLTKTPALHYWKTFPTTHLDRVLLGPTQGQLQKMYLRPEDWPIPPTPVPTPAPTIKTEAPPQIAAIPYVMGRPKNAAEGILWGLHCLICKNEEEHKEDWDGDMQREQPWMHPKTCSSPSHKALSTPSHKMLNNPNPRMHSILIHNIHCTSSYRTIRTPSCVMFLISVLNK